MRAATITCILVVGIFITSDQGQQKQTQAKDVQRAGEQAPSNPTLATKSAPAEERRTTYRKTKDYLKRAFGPEYIAAWLLVVAAGIGLRATFRTLSVLRDQTTAARDSAKAARLNAQAIIDSERPWLVVTVEKNEMMPGAGNFFFRVTNKGRTPASFVSGDFCHAFKERPDQLPAPPDYDCPFIAPSRSFLAQGEHFDIQVTLDPSNVGINPMNILKTHYLKSDSAPLEKLVFYGRVVYEDTLSKDTHKTGWCFVFFADGLRFVRTGPAGYNDYT